MPKRRENPVLRCVGCGAEFASSEAFDMHAAGRRRAPLGAPRRCHTEAEMIAMGLHQNHGSTRWSLRPRRP